jgi:mannosyl-3-phosphoglycerate synthase
MAIVVPIKNDKIKLFEGVLSGIPHDCLIIVVSNSRRTLTDRYIMEMDVVKQFRKLTEREIIMTHQKDEALAKAFRKAGYTAILDDTDLVRSGKAEGMIVGIALAKLCGKTYVGFVDADNYMPGAIWEYVKDYGAGFLLSNSPYIMVRLAWKYKPKWTEEPYFKKTGRISERANVYMNLLISKNTGFETKIVRTTCAGDHAMTLKLAECLPFASGFAAETQELLAIFEMFGGILPTTIREAVQHGVDIFQIETANPHIHEERGDEHVTEVLLHSLSALYHSPLCSDEIKREIHKELIASRAVKPKEPLSKPEIIPPIAEMNFKQFQKAISIEAFTTF